MPPQHARHVHAYLRTAFTWVAEHREVPNLMSGIKPPAPRVRRQVALKNDHEISLYWQAGASEKIGPFGKLFRLLLLLGVRRDELAEAPRTEFDLIGRVWRLPAERSKNGVAAEIHLPQLAIDIIESMPPVKSQWLFPQQRQRRSGVPATDNPMSGFGRAAKRHAAEMAKLAAEKGLPRPPHVTRHDLRRTVATGMAKLGIRQEVVNHVLHNASSTKSASDVELIYNTYKYEKECRAALDKWAAKIEKLVGIQREKKPRRPKLRIVA
jgi:integrase